MFGQSVSWKKCVCMSARSTFVCLCVQCQDPITQPEQRSSGMCVIISLMALDTDCLAVEESFATDVAL